MRIVALTNLPTGKTKYTTRPLSYIDTMVLHHVGVDLPGTEENVRVVARYHVERRGWPGIGYHYMVAKDGTIWKTNPARTVSYHVAGHNLHTLGVCLFGDLEQARPTKEQVESVVGLWRELRVVYGLRRVVGHRELYRTDCPGRYGMEVVEACRLAAA